jgi:hypothetical protein
MPGAVELGEEGTRMNTGWSRAGVGFSLLALYAGCSASPTPEGPESAERPVEGASAEALTSACVVGYTGGTIAWLLDRACACSNPTYSVDQKDQCAYEQGLVGCMAMAGLRVNCSALPILPQVNASDGRFWSVLDTSTLTSSCEVDKRLYACISHLNLEIGPSRRPYRGFPVDGAFRPRCDQSQPPPCNLPDLDVFDPCGTRSCSAG